MRTGPATAVVGAGIPFTVARLWPGGRRVERALKRCGGAGRFCPVCTPGTTWGALRITRRRGPGARRPSHRSPF